MSIRRSFGIAIAGRSRLRRSARLLRGCYADSERFRSRIVMQRHGFGQGEYQYFAEPLPEMVRQLREAAYPHLAPLANRWAQRMGVVPDYPPSFGQFRTRCHAAGRTRPTPLLLHYREGDYNCLHQDLYGGVYYPLQLIVLLSEPGEDFGGGERCWWNSGRACSRAHGW